MGKKLTNSEKIKRREKQLKNSIKKKESLDKKGIRTKKHAKGSMNPNVFRILKIISIVLIPIFYFLDSRFLILCVAFTIVVGFFAKKTEKYMNQSYIKANHIKIPKFDSILAVVVIVITFAGSILQLNSSKHRTEDNWWMDVKMSLENFGSCLTGNRRLIHTHVMNFGTAEPPDGMPAPGERPSNLSMDDLPIEAVFSMMISSVNSVLIFMVPVASFLSLLVLNKRKKKFSKEMNEIIANSYHDLSDKEVLDLFTFGYDMTYEDKELFLFDYKEAVAKYGVIEIQSTSTTETSEIIDSNVIVEAPKDTLESNKNSDKQNNKQNNNKQNNKQNNNKQNNNKQNNSSNKSKKKKR